MGLLFEDQDYSSIVADDNVVDGEKKRLKRDQWSNQFEFFLTTLGYAVGLGNVWRFPYLCYRNGGGAFLVPYFICLLVTGIPVFYMEVAFGQFASLGPLKIWSVNPCFKGIGMTFVVFSAITSIYYNMVIAYCFRYLYASMTSDLPWESCDNDWNTCECRVGTGNSSYINLRNATILKCGMSFFSNEVLQLSGGIGEVGTLVGPIVICYLVTWIIVFLVLIKGVKSLGKVMYFTAIFPYVLLTALLVRGLTLDGHYEGIMFYLKPEWEEIKKPKVWRDAAAQIFYSLSTCSGGMITMASFNRFNNNVLRDSLLVPIINCLTSFYAGFVIFSILGFMAHSTGQAVKDGPGLTFIVYPEAVSHMPVSTLWAILFFFMMVCLGLSSQFSIVETLITSICDEIPYVFNTKLKVFLFRFGVCASGFFIGLIMATQGGHYLFNLVDNSLGGFPVLIIGLFECIVIFYIYGIGRFYEDINMMIGGGFSEKLNNILKYVYFGPMWALFTPACIGLVTVLGFVEYEAVTLGDYHYPPWGDGITWIFIIMPIAFTLGWFLYYSCRNGFGRLIRESMAPKDDWGPALKENRTGRYCD
ncbi:hypothetical protein ScPMuIL_016750 [Solemya velum]